LARERSTFALDALAGELIVVIPQFILRAGHKDFFTSGVQNLRKNGTKPKKSSAAR
jgi:hypothetical protein